VRDRRLECIEAIIQRQQRVSAKGNDDRLVFNRQHGRRRLLGAGLQIANEATFLPLGNGLWVDAVAPGERGGTDE
jgi:hypothetical protein